MIGVNLESDSTTDSAINEMILQMKQGMNIVEEEKENSTVLSDDVSGSIGKENAVPQVVEGDGSSEIVPKVSSRRGRKPKNVQVKQVTDVSQDVSARVIFYPSAMQKSVLSLLSGITGKTVSQLVIDAVNEKYINGKTLEQILEFVQKVNNKL